MLVFLSQFYKYDNYFGNALGRYFFNSIFASELRLRFYFFRKRIKRELG
jgi:hypothetical protein